jgi:hypothetical protein
MEVHLLQLLQDPFMKKQKASSYINDQTLLNSDLLCKPGFVISYSAQVPMRISLTNHYDI